MRWPSRSLTSDRAAPTLLRGSGAPPDGSAGGAHSDRDPARHAAGPRPTVRETSCPSISSPPTVAARYGGSAPADVVTNDVIELQLAHRSVRRYLPDEVTRPSSPRWSPPRSRPRPAPTCSSGASWRSATTSAVRRCPPWPGDQAHITQAPLLLVWLVDLAEPTPSPPPTRRRPRGRTSWSRRSSGSSTRRWPRRTPCSPPSRSASGRSTSGRCATARRRSRTCCDLPQHVFAAFGLVVGRPDLSENTRVKPRLPQSAVLHHEIYDDAEHADAVAAYEGRIGEFYAEEGLYHSWIERVLARLSGPAALNGRDQLRSALQAQGFGLR